MEMDPDDPGLDRAYLVDDLNCKGCGLRSLEELHVEAWEDISYEPLDCTSILRGIGKCSSRGCLSRRYSPGHR